MLPVEIKMRRSAALGVPPMLIMPAPLVVSSATIEQAGALAELLGRAYPTERWEAEGTELELFQDETIKETLVVADEGRLVATASLQVRSDVPTFGQIRWVATELDWRREGIAKHLVAELLSIAEKNGCAETRLQTTTDLLGAIALYLQLGFEPIVSDSTERRVWKQVFTLLRGESSS